MREKQKRQLTVLLLAILVLVSVLSAAKGKKPEKDLRVRSSTERIHWLQEAGWNVDPNSETREELRLPKDFPPILEAYNELQKQQGFDLKRYAGKTVRIYSYILAEANCDGLNLVTLYEYRSRVIGGDVHSAALDGGMVGLLGTGDV